MNRQSTAICSLLVGAMALSTPAQAGTDIALELGSLGTPDATWAALSDRARIPTMGVRIATPIPLDDRFRLVADWHHGMQGGRVDVAGAAVTDGEWDEGWSSFTMGIISDQISVGAEVERNVHPWVTPYATGRLLGYRAVFLMDDDTHQDDNPNQIRSVAFQPGAIGSIGARVVTDGGEDGSSLRLSVHGELGYAALLGKLEFDNTPSAADEGAAEPVAVGDLGASGLFLRAGLGIRF